MDRIHAYAPGWDFPKLSPDNFCNHFGLVSDSSPSVLQTLDPVQEYLLYRVELTWVVH